MTEQVQKPVDHKVCGMIPQCLALFGGFPHDHAMGQDDVAQRMRLALGQGHVFCGEGQDIGGLVLAAPRGVQCTDGFVAREDETHVIVIWPFALSRENGSAGRCRQLLETGELNPASVVDIDRETHVRRGFAVFVS